MALIREGAEWRSGERTAGKRGGGDCGGEEKKEREGRRGAAAGKW